MGKRGRGEPGAVERSVEDAPVRYDPGEIPDGEVVASDTRLEFAVVVLINAVLWTMAIAAIYDFAQRLVAPKIGIYPIVAGLQMALT